MDAFVLLAMSTFSQHNDPKLYIKNTNGRVAG